MFYKIDSLLTENCKKNSREIEEGLSKWGDISWS